MENRKLYFTIIIAFTFLFLSGCSKNGEPVLFFSFNKEKIAEYEKNIENLNSQIELLKTENENLRKEIDTFKLTEQNDQYFYQLGADAFLRRDFATAISYMEKLKVKFPASPLIGYADKIIKDASDPSVKEWTRKGTCYHFFVVSSTFWRHHI